MYKGQKKSYEQLRYTEMWFEISSCNSRNSVLRARKKTDKKENRR
jgi:hypothetical protein